MDLYEIERLEHIQNTLAGLKKQSEIAMDMIFRKKTKEDSLLLAKAHKLITPSTLKDPALRRHMLEENIVSYVDVNIKSFNKKFALYLALEKQ